MTCKCGKTPPPSSDGVSSHRKKWEYYGASITTTEVAERLNWYGEQGWELVTANLDYKLYSNKTLKYSFVFKREKI